MNKTAFAISIALTAFVLMLVGGIVYTVHVANAAQTAAAATLAPATDPSAAATQQDLVQAFNQREAAYQQLIAEANARLEQAQQQQQALEQQLAALQAANPAATSAAPAATITPEQAVSIASNALGQTSVYSVEATTIQGQNVYMVTFSSGDIVYVDPQGQIVGSVSAQQTAAQSSSRSSGHEGHENEHGGDD